MRRHLSTYAWIRVPRSVDSGSSFLLRSIASRPPLLGPTIESRSGSMFSLRDLSSQRSNILILASSLILDVCSTMVVLSTS